MDEPPERYEDFTPRAVSSLAQGESVDLEPTLTSPQAGPEEPEKPIGPLQNIHKVISETEDIIRGQLNITIDQRRFMRLVSYMIDALQKLVADHYKPHLDKINSFLVRNDKLQERWIACYCKILPTYGDYTTVLEDSPNLINVQDIPKAMKESSLKSLAEEVTSGLYASAMQVRAMRARNEEMNNYLDMFREVCEEKYLPYDKWLELCRLHLDNLEFLQAECFKDLSNIDFNDLDASGSSSATLNADSH